MERGNEGPCAIDADGVVGQRVNCLGQGALKRGPVGDFRQRAEEVGPAHGIRPRDIPLAVGRMVAAERLGAQGDSTALLSSNEDMLTFSNHGSASYTLEKEALDVIENKAFAGGINRG